MARSLDRRLARPAPESGRPVRAHSASTASASAGHAPGAHGPKRPVGQPGAEHPGLRVDPEERAAIWPKCPKVAGEFAVPVQCGRL